MKSSEEPATRLWRIRLFGKQWNCTPKENRTFWMQPRDEEDRELLEESFLDYVEHESKLDAEL